MTDPGKRQILSGALLVLPAAATEGSLIIENGRIAEIAPGKRYRDGLDLSGRYLIPGVIDIHTDYVEKEIAPRPEARFPFELALHYMDLRAVSCGITTLLSSARISEERAGILGTWTGDGLELARRYESFINRTKAKHLIHVRWDTSLEPVDDALAELQKLKSIGNLVYNENIPGERQFRDVEGIIRRQAINRNISIDESRKLMEARIAKARSVNNRAKVKAALGGRIPLGSHDDTTVEHVVEAYDAGATLSEMPCTIEAARKAKELGMMVCMGAPNYYRGGSHCGNLSCAEALDEGLVDILCSDYHFPSLLAGALRMIERGVHPSQAINLISLNPARYLGLGAETGSIESGKRADLAVVEPRRGYGAVSQVWVEGQLRFQADEPLGEVLVSSGRMVEECVRA
ncbi:MAG TPA: alpha-D-ribose 1-methylphosphonate 5-triphosphate diphosphatase [Bryobacteraceae bacterium]|nr:alpha-D-ribose 1-methylphosphonate 5-triphosphate diphosphatase [Bryobacteraceae bacterium]